MFQSMEGAGVEECLKTLRAQFMLPETLTHDDDGATHNHMRKIHPEGRSILCRGHWLKTQRKKMVKVRGGCFNLCSHVRQLGDQFPELQGLGAHFQKWLRSCFARSPDNYAQFEVLYRVPCHELTAVSKVAVDRYLKHVLGNHEDCDHGALDPKRMASSNFFVFFLPCIDALS